MRIAFIGLGVMGFPIAGHLARAGHSVTVYNRTGTKAVVWVNTYGGNAAPTPMAAAHNAEIVFACVGDDNDIREVTLGHDGAFHSMPPGSIFIDHTTTSAEVARDLYLAADIHGIAFLDAPVSGGQKGAENGALTVMAGGDEEAFARAEPLMRSYAKQISLMGPAGSGQLTKMVNQICIAGLVQALAEGLNFAQAVGLDGAKVVEAISQGAAQSWQMDNRWKTMLEGEFNFGFAVDWMRKDLGMCLAEASRVGATLPVTALVDQFYAEIQSQGGNRWDTSSLISRLSR